MMTNAKQACMYIVETKRKQRARPIRGDGWNNPSDTRQRRSAGHSVRLYC